MNLKNHYDKWIEEGKPELAAGEIDQLLNEAWEIDLEDDNANLLAPVACTCTQGFPYWGRMGGGTPPPTS